MLFSPLQNSDIKCDRKRCVRSTCNKNTSRNRSNTYSPAQTFRELTENDDECCATQCRRARRHQNQKHRIHREKIRKQRKTFA